MIRTTSIFLVVLAAVMAASLLTGQPAKAIAPGASTSNNATVITSEEFDLDFGSPKRVAVYRGKVKVVDPEMEITCELMTVSFASSTNKPPVIPAPTNGVKKTKADLSSVKSLATAPNNATTATPIPPPVRPMVGMGGNIESIIAERNVEIINKVEKTRATGNKAVYTSATELLVLTGNPVMYTDQGEVRGDIIILDRRTNKLSVKRATVSIGENNKTRDNNSTKGKPPVPPTKNGNGAKKN